MAQNRILAFSSSRAGNGAFLESALPEIGNFLGDGSFNIAFIPFASVKNDHDDYGSMVQEALGGHFVIHTLFADNAKKLIEAADVIVVGGGNTFKLLHDVYQLKLLDVLRDKLNNGFPYIGWSAGSNILCPTIGTTNDMPIIEPQSFKALGLLPFQINPHYTNVKPEGHYGETRDQRLEEFAQINPGVPVIGLPEGSALKLDNQVLTYIGTLPAMMLCQDKNQLQAARTPLQPGEDLSFLMNG
jgi:dipeptidase E